MPGLLGEALLHHASLLRAAVYSVRLRSRSRHSLHGGDRRSAGSPARPAQPYISTRLSARWCIRSSMATSLISRRRWDDARSHKPAASFWPMQMRLSQCRCTGGGTGSRRFNQSALLAAPVAKASDLPIAPRAQTGEIPHQQAGLLRAARRQHPGRAPGAGQWQGGGRGQKAYSDRRRLTSGPSRAAPRQCCGRAGGTSTCWCSPGLPRAA